MSLESMRYNIFPRPEVLLSSLHSWLVSLGTHYPSMYSHDPDSSHLAKQSTLTVLKGIITTGYLEISDLADTYYYGRQQDGCKGVCLKVIDDKFWLRVFL